MALSSLKWNTHGHSVRRSRSPRPSQVKAIEAKPKSHKTKLKFHIKKNKYKSEKMEIERKMSDEGYNSEESGRKSPPIEKLAGRSDSRRIALENKEFKKKYKIEKILNNSANGVIYEGKRVFDGLPVCVKQVPKSRISDWGNIEGRKVPKEFEMHLKATKSQGVVQVYDFYERKTR